MKRSGIAFLILIGFWGMMASSISSCKKDNNTQNQDTTKPVDTTKQATYMEKMFELYVLNSANVITLAVDSSGNNLTPNYQDETIYLRKNTYYDGPLEIFAGGTKYTGTWKSNSDYSTLELNISGRPEFAFFDSPWRFTYKSLTLLKLAPIQNPGQKVMHLEKK
jgi:hypothetical protein